MKPLFLCAILLVSFLPLANVSATSEEVCCDSTTVELYLLGPASSGELSPFEAELSDESEEKKISDLWIKKGLFKPRKSKSNKKFSVVIPPPNITGRLHMGHALNNSLQDVLVRFNRMKGLETLWQPGTDHAGIATQAIVEKNLEKDGVKKSDLGRDKFIKKVWKWKEESGGIILEQLKKLGC